MADGGNVGLHEIDSNIVQLKLQGACGSCPSSVTTVKMGIERRLMDKIPEIVAVEPVSDQETGLELNAENIEKMFTYENVVERVANQLGVDDPSKLRLISHNCYSQQPKLQPIKYRGVEHLSEMLVHYNEVIFSNINQRTHDLSQFLMGYQMAS
ncbi:NifU-like protein 2 [Carex littledalei]|uniref:NifU-like protein 2 n=1 Tax=Carex littledalei TaxID=544730 RepID=A0A833QV07_9POAL|nr:NifU-like protein 2 [Carex littledalei]